MEKELLNVLTVKEKDIVRLRRVNKGKEPLSALFLS
jgi:hypothetical protein